MNWKYLFDREALGDGRKLYVEGAVTLLPGMTGGFFANVLDDGIYQVSATVSNDRIAAISCTCREGKAGRRCRHMAAVLYEVDALSDKLNQTREEIRQETASGAEERVPFPASESEAYQYFDVAKAVKDAWITRGQLTRAKAMVEEKRIRLIRFSQEYDEAGKPVLHCYGEISGGDTTGSILYDMVQSMRGAQSYSDISRAFTRRGSHQDLVQIRMDCDRILDHSCQSYNCGRRQSGFRLSRTENPRREEFCDHELALLLLMQERIDRENPGDATDERSGNFLAACRAGSLFQPEEGDVRLEPRLEIGEEELRLSFRVGVLKRYVIRSLPAFCAAVRSGEKVTLGTSEEVDFGRQSFTPESAPYYDLLEEIVHPENDRMNERSMGFVSDLRTVKKDAELYGALLDRFFEVAKGQEIPVSAKAGDHKKKIRPEEGDVSLTFRIQRILGEDGVFHGIELKGKLPHFYQGSRYAYYVEGDRLIRISQERKRQLRLLTMYERNGELRLSIGRYHLAAFYRDVLPGLQKIARIEEEDAEKTAAYLPPAAEFVFYIDGEEESASCRAQVRYGEKSFALMRREIGPVDPVRDPVREEGALRLIEDYFPVPDREQERYLTGSEEDLFRLVEKGFSEFLSAGEVQTTDRFKKIRIRRSLPVTVGISLENDLMDLSVSSEDVTQQELREILASYRRKKRFYRLRGGDLLDLSAPAVEGMSQLMDAMHLAPEQFTGEEMKVPVYRALYLDQMLHQSQAVYGMRDTHFRRLVKEFKTIGDSDFEIPAGLASPLRNYQRYGYRWLRTLEHLGFGGILADEMGLGKTIQMIALILAAKEEGRDCHSLIICPASLVYNWQEEVRRFAPSLKPLVIAGTQSEREELLAESGAADILITSYDLLRRDLKLYEEMHFAFEVIDEAQYIKNHTTAAAKSVKVIGATHRFALTGTPIENRLSELWSIFDYLMPGFLYEYRVFREELESPIVREHDEEATQRLRSMVSPFILRRQKKEVLKDLPEKLEQLRYAKMEREQQQVYDGQVVEMRDRIEHTTDEEYRTHQIQILSELMKLRQICCDPSLLFEDYHGPSAKREACLELIRSAMEGGHKILVFSQFVSMLELLEQDLTREMIPYYTITGQTPKGERMERVKAFNSDDTPVFLISLRAGGTGLNLTGADVVIHYDPWWNLAVQNQATDRAHRIGQTKEVSVYKLIIKDSLEEKILKMQEKKKDLAEEILAGEGSNLMKMTREEILDLLS